MSGNNQYLLLLNGWFFSFFESISNLYFDFYSVFILLSCHNLKKSLNLLKK